MRIPDEVLEDGVGEQGHTVGPGQLLCYTPKHYHQVPRQGIYVSNSYQIRS